MPSVFVCSLWLCEHLLVCMLKVFVAMLVGAACTFQHVARGCVKFCSSPSGRLPSGCSAWASVQILHARVLLSTPCFYSPTTPTRIAPLSVVECCDSCAQLHTGRVKHLEAKGNDVKRAVCNMLFLCFFYSCCCNKCTVVLLFYRLLRRSEQLTSRAWTSASLFIQQRRKAWVVNT